MSRPTLDSATLAARMNARPLPEDCDGGQWDADTVALDGLPCETCKRAMTKWERCVTCFPCAGEVLALCLPCALADCERAEAAPVNAALNLNRRAKRAWREYESIRPYAGATREYAKARHLTREHDARVARRFSCAAHAAR